MVIILKLCIGGDLDGMKIDLNKKRFNAGEIEAGKSSQYYKQIYVKNDKIYSFWICEDSDILEISKRIEQILSNPQ